MIPDSSYDKEVNKNRLNLARTREVKLVQDAEAEEGSDSEAEQGVCLGR